MITASDAPMSAATAIHNVAHPNKASTMKTTLMEMESTMFCLMMADVLFEIVIAKGRRERSSDISAMSAVSRPFSRRGRAEAKAGENIGQAKPRQDVIEKTKQTDQQKEISEVSLTRKSEPLFGNA
jgi:hypothetical protein